MVSKESRQMRFIDLFSGLGAFSLGLERAGHETAAFCEIAPYPRRVLAKHWPKVPCYHDVREITAARLAADGITANAICGGFPCQDISVAGKGAGIEGERSGLWSEFARLIGELGPEIAIIENVARLVRLGLGRVLGDLASMGYDAEWGPLPASFAGAPHKRQRLWIIAYPERGERRQEPYLRAVGRMGRSQQSVPWDRNWEVALRELRGVDDGSAYRVDRVDTLRNAVIPQIPEMIGRAIQMPSCPYCGATEGLRVKSNGGGFEEPEYTCEGCFTGSDDGPGFDDLPSTIIRPCVFPYCNCEKHCNPEH
jgi:DNA (cytosine-5)-methyltransferase 1